MNKSLWIASAIAAAVVVPVLAGCGQSSADNHGAKADTQAAASEKCYGIVKAGKNDCETASASCAGTATMDRMADAWIYLPKGLCDKIAGASLTAPASKS